MKRYMMARGCIYPDSSVPFEQADYELVYVEEKAGWYEGQWLTGLGITGVKFPKQFVRELTQEEREKYHGAQVCIGNLPSHKLQLLED